MDPLALAYYALICGLLGLAAPRLGGSALRFGVGVAVGLLAASVLPLLRALVGAG